jgi:GcrA cell cycle regulator
MSVTGSTWSPERVEELKRCFEAGLSCGQIARAIGVTRNAVIGKVSRLGLSRPPGVAATRLRRGSGARPARPPMPRRLRASVFAQHAMLQQAFVAEAPIVATMPIHNGRGCTLLELERSNCRWPFSGPGSADVHYCGNEPVPGLSYCAAHARIAYRPAGRLRSA